jgi:transposase
MNLHPEYLRKRIIEALEAEKESQTGTAALFGVSLSFVQKLWRRWRETGSYSAKPRGGVRIPRSLKDDEAKVRAAVTAQPDATLAELCQIVKSANGAIVSRMTMCRELRRLKLATARCKRKSL